VRYLPPFERIKSQLRISQVRGGTVRVNATYEDLMRMIQVLLVGIDVDEAWYLQQNEDVVQGMREGKIRSAKEHFVDHGYFEGRAPFPMAVDESWYLATNADVAEQVRLGTFESGQAHFNQSGYHEGRLPRAL
jgi:hypothetical protein